MRKSLRIATLAACTLLAAATAQAQYDDDPGPNPGGGTTCPAGEVAVTAQANNRFVPDEVTIKVGDIVCFRNPSNSIPHNIRSLGKFQCSEECDDNGGNPTSPAGEPAAGWLTRIRFTKAETVDFHCDLHVNMGMRGKIIVEADDGGGGGGDEPGNISFTNANFSVGEAGPNATINVRRTGGDNGAVSVQYATANGSATAGSDYTTRTGTLNWPDNDDNNKSFTIPISNDTADEPNETVQLSLSGPTGGAGLGTPASATLTINDNDDPAPGPTAPAAPTNLKAVTSSTTEIALTFNDNASNETEFRIERRTLTGTFTQFATVGANVTQFTAGGLQPATYYEFRVRAANGAGTSAYTNATGTSTDDTPGPCVETGGAICINNDRFKVALGWRNEQGSGVGVGVGLDFAPDSGVLYFFSPSNLELLIKLLNACPLNDRYWVFFAATTNVEFTLTVTDTQTGKVKTYFNPLGTAAAPIQDTSAFDTCP